MATDIGSALPNATTIPFGHVPTWLLLNADNQSGLPLVGQFDPQVKKSNGDPIWIKKPAVLGGQPWLRYIGKGMETLTFTFHAIANSILDLYPDAAWNALKNLSGVDATLARPPRVYFVYGAVTVQGYLTSVPAAQFQHWPNTKLTREIGPVEIEITLVVGDEVALFTSTSYVTMTDETRFEELAKSQYGDAMYGAALAEINQGAVIGDQLALPRRNHPDLRRSVGISSYFDMSDVIGDP